MTVCVQIKLFLGTYLLLTKVYLCHSKSIFEEYTKAIACIATSLPFKTAHTKVLNIPSHLPPFGGQSGTLHFVRTVVQSGKAVKWYCNALLRSTLKTCLRKPSLLWITGFRGLDLQETQKVTCFKNLNVTWYIWQACDDWTLPHQSCKWLTRLLSFSNGIKLTYPIYPNTEFLPPEMMISWLIYSIVLVERDKTHICELDRNHPEAGTTFNKHLHFLSSTPNNAWKHT